MPYWQKDSVHMNGVNAAFLDGHARWAKIIDNQEYGGALDYYGQHPCDGFEMNHKP